MTEDPRRGITLMIAVTTIFAAQDGLSRHLAEATNVLMVNVQLFQPLTDLLHSGFLVTKN